jgi:uroporphyrinogen III methyltransferase/synthase
MSKVYLVGAGPGDAGLITLKGLEKIKACDAIVYDRLASEELLDYVSSQAEKIYVGKAANEHYKSQDEINRILIDCAGRHENIVRLKGGDSFVFGRGGEEIEALEKENIPYEVIPGVSSAIAVPECAGIPVTHRGISRSFHVITGHTKASGDKSPDYDYKNLAELEGTLVFLMGLSNLGDIAKRLIDEGKPANTPVAVISNGTMEMQKIVKGELFDIAEKVIEASLPSPAVIVIGATAACDYLYHNKLEYSISEDTAYDKHLASEVLNTTDSMHRSEKDRPKYVGITSTDLLWKKLKSAFEKIGMQPVRLCKMKIEESASVSELITELHHLYDYGWMIFTSQNSIEIFFKYLKKEKIDLRVLAEVKFAVIGSGTAEKLLSYGFVADLIPPEYTVEALSRKLADTLKPEEKVLIPRAAKGSPELTGMLSERNIIYKEIPVYDVLGSFTGNIKYLNEMDYLVFVSASGASAFFDELKNTGRKLPEGIKIACIGKVTAKKLNEASESADIIASACDVSGLIEAFTNRV